MGQQNNYYNALLKTIFSNIKRRTDQDDGYDRYKVTRKRRPGANKKRKDIFDIIEEVSRHADNAGGSDDIDDTFEHHQDAVEEVVRGDEYDVEEFRGTIGPEQEGVSLSDSIKVQVVENEEHDEAVIEVLMPEVTEEEIDVRYHSGRAPEIRLAYVGSGDKTFLNENFYETSFRLPYRRDITRVEDILAELSGGVLKITCPLESNTSTTYGRGQEIDVL